MVIFWCALGKKVCGCKATRLDTWHSLARAFLVQDLVNIVCSKEKLSITYKYSTCLTIRITGQKWKSHHLTFLHYFYLSATLILICCLVCCQHLIWESLYKCFGIIKNVFCSYYCFYTVSLVIAFISSLNFRENYLPEGIFGRK